MFAALPGEIFGTFLAHWPVTQFCTTLWSDFISVSFA